jgi:hypothetical protein
VKQRYLGLEFLRQRSGEGGRGQGFRAEIGGVNDLPDGNLSRSKILSFVLDRWQLRSSGNFRANRENWSWGLAQNLFCLRSQHQFLNAGKPVGSDDQQVDFASPDNFGQTLPHFSFPNVNLVGDSLQM